MYDFMVLAGPFTIYLMFVVVVIGLSKLNSNGVSK